jgi:hypothetical protein
MSVFAEQLLSVGPSACDVTIHSITIQQDMWATVQGPAMRRGEWILVNNLPWTILMHARTQGNNTCASTLRGKVWDTPEAKRDCVSLVPGNLRGDPFNFTEDDIKGHQLRKSARMVFVHQSIPYGRTF